MTTNYFKNVPKLETNGTIVETQLDDIAAHTKMCKKIFGRLLAKPRTHAGTFVFEFALMRAQTLGQSQNDPDWSQIDIRFAPNSQNINKNDNKLFKNVPKLQKNGTIVETQLDDIAAQVHQNV